MTPKGGRFKIASASDGVTTKQMYWPETNVLVTRFLSDDGVGEVIDFMPVGNAERHQSSHQIVRRVDVVRGSMTFRMDCIPAFNYARDAHEIELTGNGAVFSAPGLSLKLSTNMALTQYQGGATAEFTLQEGETLTFTFGEITPGDDDPGGLSESEAEESFERTVEYWRRWLSKCRYKGRWREMVERSALVLKMLTVEPKQWSNEYKVKAASRIQVKR